MADTIHTDGAKDNPTPFDKFKDLTSRLFSVGKDELDEALKQEEQESDSKKSDTCSS